MFRHWNYIAVCFAVVAILAIREAPAADAITPLNGKNLDGWKLKGDNREKSNWTIGSATLADDQGQLNVDKAGDHLINAKGGGVDIYTEQKFGDGTYELEVMVPKGSNSGIYLMGEYEVQVFDSYGKQKPGGGDMGAIYGASPPKVNASKQPGEWQKYVIEFRAPKFDASGKTANARFVKITLNDQVIHENVEMTGPTPGGLSGKEQGEAPLMFQGDHGAVAYRNIKITAAQ